MGDGVPLQPAGGELRLARRFTALRRVLISYVAHRGRIDISVPSSRYVIMVPVSGVIWALPAAQPVMCVAGSALALNPGEQASSVWGADAAAWIIELREADVASQAAAWLGGSPPAPVRFAADVDAMREPASGWARRLWRLVAELQDAESTNVESSEAEHREGLGLGSDSGWVDTLERFTVADTLLSLPNDCSVAFRAVTRADAPTAGETSAGAAGPAPPPRSGAHDGIDIRVGESQGQMIQRLREERGLSYADLARRWAEEADDPSINRQKVSDYVKERRLLGPTLLQCHVA